MERELHEPPGVLVLPDRMAPRCAVLVLSGSSGRLETERARLFAAHGAAAAAVTYFGGPGQPPGLCEVPLETFTPVLDALADHHEHLAVVGASKGAEAALLLAARDQRVRAVAALAPSSLVWANVGPGPDGRTHPYRSSWTRHGQPLPFVPYEDTWPGADRLEQGGGAPEPVAVRGWYEASMAAYPEEASAAAIPVERIDARVLLAAGGDDQVWPSAVFAEQIAQRRAEADLATTVLTHPGAGHRIPLPGEAALPATNGGLVRGGTPDADAALGAEVWHHLVGLLHLRPGWVRGRGQRPRPGRPR